MVVSTIPGSLVPSVEFDAGLIRKLSGSGPVYRSYPTADRFTGAFGYRDYLQAIAGLRTRGHRNSLSLYLHIPLRTTVGAYCASHKIPTKGRARVNIYLGYLKREIEMQGKLFTGMSQVGQLHVCGGTPTYLSDAQMADLTTHLRRWFQLAPDDIGEYSIEVDSRTVSRERIRSLREQGFNQISLGVQEFDPEVQHAINRTQLECQTADIIDAAHI